MEKKQMRTLPMVLLILCSLAVNWGGDQLMTRLNWPIWLDSVGTVLCAYLLGPFCGAVVGGTGNLLAHVLYGTPWFYVLISILIGVMAGIAARRGKLETLLDTLTTSMILAGTVAISAYPINLIMNSGSTGNSWGDAVIGFLNEAGIPRWIGLLVGELYVEMLDKLVILVFMFTVIHLLRKTRGFFGRIGGSRRKKGKGRKKTAAAVLAAAICLSALSAGMTPARAESQGNGTDINYTDYVQTIYSTSNGLPCGEANDIAMTGDGIMWIGTYAGLYRYNGREFRWMDSFDSIRNVNCLYVDEQGRLWVGSNDNGLSIIINEQVVNVIDQSLGLPSNSVKSIIKSSDGYYYIGTTGSMLVLTLNCGLKRVGILSEVAYADHSAADGDGNVAVVDNEGTLYLMREGQVISSRKLNNSQTVFKSCIFDPDGLLLAATTGNEIYRFRVSAGSFELLDTMECPSLLNIKNLQFLENGDLFICADNGIAYLNESREYELINTNEFNNSIDNMLMDYQGNLWFTSSRLGLLRLAPSDFRDIYSTVGMENRVVNTIVQWNGVYYFGTDKGMDAVDLKGKHRITDEVTSRFEGIRIRCMIVDRDGHLWVCTYGSGLMELCQDGTVYQYSKDNGAFGNRARVVKQLEDGTILAAGDTGLSFIRDHHIEHTIDRTDGKISSMVLSITELPDGDILAGTDGNGLAVLRDRQVIRTLTRTDGLSSEVILRTVADTKTSGVFLVTSNGLCYMNPDHTIRKLDNFPYYNNYDIWIRGTDQLYVMSSAGIYMVDRNELLSGKDEISYDLLNSGRGLNGSLTANAWTWFSEESNELYLPCDTGVFAFNTTSFTSGTRVYRMNLRGVRMDGTLYPTVKNSTMKIPRGTGRVELIPEVINYTIQEPYVGYKLEGFDGEWHVVPQNSLGTVPYTNLPAGKYVFHLAVYDSNQEQIVAERTYNLEKEKEMYDNNWFIIYILSVPMFTVCWITWLQVKKRERKMQEQLAEAERRIEMGKQTVTAIAKTVDAKDKKTREHSDRVAKYSRLIAEAYGLDEKQCRDIEWSAQMHDIGKIAIPDKILNKDSRLTDEEYAQMKSHTSHGADILRGFTLVDNVIDGAEYHHERYDGRGYPKGLKGEDIPLYARIIGVADAFDAMTANRVYRKQMDFGYVLGELDRGRGTQFDPQFVDILLKLISDGVINMKEIYIKPEDEQDPAEKTAAEKNTEQEKSGTKEKPVKTADGKEEKAGGKTETQNPPEEEKSGAENPQEKDHSGTAKDGSGTESASGQDGAAQGGGK